MARQSVFDMHFSSVYSALIKKAERKGRTKAEVDEVTSWLTILGEQINAAMESLSIGSWKVFHGGACL